MLTTPYKVLIACSSLLLLAAVSYRLIGAAGGEGAAEERVVAAGSDAGEGKGAEARTDGFQGAPMPPLDLPPPRVDRPAPDGSDGSDGPGGDMVPLGPDAPADPPFVFPSPTPPGPEAGPEVPTLVIGRQPGEPREKPAGRAADAADDGDEEEATASDPERVYVVKAGDSLQAIASRTLGDANRWGRIAELNPGVDPLRLQVGDRLKLPPEAEAAPAGVQPARTAAAAGSTHTVQAGDSLSVIALRYYGDSTRWKAIYEANRSLMKSPDDLGIGVELRIPPAAASDR